MAGRSFTRHSNGVGNRIRAEHINELQVASEADDSRIDAKLAIADAPAVVRDELAADQTVVAAAAAAASDAVLNDPDLSTIVPVGGLGPGEVIVGGENGPVAVDAESIGGGVAAMATGAPPAFRVGGVVAGLGAGETWVRFGTYPTAELNVADTSDRFLGATHVSFPVAAGVSQGATVSGITSINLNEQAVVLWVKADIPASVASVRVYFHSSPTARFYITQATTMLSGWTPVVFDFGPGVPRTVVGGETVDTAAITQLGIQFVGATGATATRGRIGGVTTIPRNHAAFPNGVASITFDDNWLTQYTYAYPEMMRRGMRGTLYTICDAPGSSANYMTLDNLKQMHATGWEVGGHAYTYANHDRAFDALTRAELESEFGRCREWIISHGFGSGDNFAWPQGKYNALALSVAEDYLRTARRAAASDQGQRPYLPTVRSRYELNTQYPDGAASWIDSYVSNSVANGRWMIFVMHGIETGPLANSLAEFRAILDALDAADVPVLPVGEVLQKLAVPQV